MTKESCTRYLEDPESHAGHLAECAECRDVFENLEAAVDHKPVRVDALPLAPWEGAGHRPWSLIIGGAIAVAVIAVALFAMSGLSPADISIPSAGVFVSFFRVFSGAIQNAPAAWQIAIGIGFVAVNAFLIVLLRRAPKGIDA